MAKYDVIVIGAGHQGLTVGARLGKAGLKALVLEKHSILGGCTKTENNILPGFKVDGGGVVLQHPCHRLAKELNLKEFGYEAIEPPPDKPITTYLFGDDIQFSAYKDVEATCAEIGKYSKKEADNYRKLVNDWAPLSRAVAEVYQLTEPTYTQLFSVLESMGPKVMWLYLASISEILKTYFSTDWLAGLARVPWVVGVHPTYPGTGFTTQYLPHLHWAPYYITKGGMQGFIGPLAKAVEHLGGKVQNNSGVRNVIIENGQAKGVRLESGEEIEGKIIVSSTHVQRTYLDFVGEKKLEPDFVRYVKGLKDASSMFVLYLELDYKFPIESINFMILKGYDHVEREATAVSSNRRPDPPTLWMSNNCPWDPTLAPPGKTFISVMGVVPWKLEGTTWEAEQEKHADSIIKAVESRVPGFRKHIVNRNMHSPAFFEKEYYLHNASTYALSYLLTQMWSMKPQYRTPIKNLYATGQTTHPGAGINGLAGTNTTKVILKDLEEKKIKL